MDAAGNGMLRFGQGVQRKSLCSSPARQSLPRTHTDYRPTDRTSLSVGMLSDRARRNTRDRFHRFYQRDDFTGSTCVPCVKTVELERPPVCRVKPAQLKSHESPVREITRTGG